MNNAPRKHYRNGISLIKLTELIPVEQSAETWFVENLWEGHPKQCPSCRVEGKCKTVPNRDPLPYHCGACRKYFSVKTGTVMERSKLLLRQWLIGFFLCATSLKGVSSMKLHRDLGITQKSAYFMGQRIRKAWESSQGKMFGHVEVY